MQFDWSYLCQGLGRLTGLETGVYKGSECIEWYSHTDFGIRFATLILEDALERQESAFYMETREWLVFGVVRLLKEDITVIVGPTAQTNPGQKESVALLGKLGVPYDHMRKLDEYLSCMINYPFENFLSIICFLNYAMNEEKLSVSQLVAREGRGMGFPTTNPHPKEYNAGEARPTEGPHNTWHTEKRMLSLVTAGDVEAITAFLTQPPTGRSGVLANNALRQRKNLFICAATLVSRAAIAGGVSPEVAFALSDRYIQKAELLNNNGDITALSMEMLVDYTKQVAFTKCGATGSRLAADIFRYVQRHMNQRITTAELSDHMKMNRSYLCERFKLETGKTVNGFITAIKMEEAKRLLCETNWNISKISDYLAFSSQSYFQTVFKQHESCTPKAYKTRRTQTTQTTQSTQSTHTT